MNSFTILLWREELEGGNSLNPTILSRILGLVNHFPIRFDGMSCKTRMTGARQC
jgi:hypothetical protein